MDEPICGEHLIVVAPPARDARRMTLTDRPTAAPPVDRGRPVCRFGAVLCADDSGVNGRAARRHAARLASPGATIEIVPAGRLTQCGRRSLRDACAGHDLLVLGAGAPASAAAAHAPIPVLIARSCPLGTELTDTMLVPVADSPASRGAVELAGRLAAADSRSTVTIVAAPPRDPALQRAIAASRRLLLRATGASPLVVGDQPTPERAIPAAAAALGASLVVLGSGAGVIERRTTARIADCLACSILVVPAPAAGRAAERSRAARAPREEQRHLDTAVDDVALLRRDDPPRPRWRKGPPSPVDSTERTPMPHRVLVVTNEDLADADSVPPPIRPLIADAHEIYVVAPTLTTRSQWLTDDKDGARVTADERLRTIFDHMRAEKLEPDGAIGAENQITAIGDALAEFDADLIVLRLHARGSDHENWREHRLAGKVRSHFDVPTIAFYFDSEGRVVERDEGTGAPPCHARSQTDPGDA